MPRRVVASGRSCLECRRRKIKCDRSVPCAYCIRTRTECTYPPKPTDREAVSSDHDPLLARVERLECILQSLQSDLAQVRHRLPITSDNCQEQEGDQVGSAVRHDLRCSSPASHPPRSFAGRLGHSFPFHLGPSLPLGPLHPSPPVISTIWQTYLDVVDPVLKIFHVPTVQRHVFSLIRGQPIRDARTECLIFAIYYSTVVAMSAAECQSEFHEERATLLSRYRMGVEHALLKANFLNSVDMMVLQAFSLYLICGRRDENGPDVCALIGVAIGTAMKIGLHSDGAATGLRPFEVEMRRRLWWQICTLDVRTAEDHGVEPSIMESAFTTELPSNVNDASLDPNMSELPQAQLGRTEMLFSLVRFEVSRFARRVVFSDRFCSSNSYPILNETQKCKAIDKFREHIEKQYLAYCDKGVPLDCVTAAITRLILVKLKLAVFKPRRDRKLVMPVRGDYGKACEEVLHHASRLRQYERGTRWLWLFQTYVEWDALAYLLLELCLGPSWNPSGTAWRAANEVYHHWKNDPDIRRDRRWRHIEELRTQALTVRERMQGTPPTSNSREQSDLDATVVADVPVHNTGIPQVSNSTKITEECSPFVSANQRAECNLSTEQASAICGPTSVATEATARPLAPSAIPSSGAELPGGGTACEWSTGLFEQYWQVAEPGQGDSRWWL
ncbi:hypothetical protein Asppvi_004009 [Aspergillus pseudoviridinutans]|uniref:Zn(2)-C6 fungal-type domain-containing protein n=1 Tax=Aspergillus pseudoviridinutans TaxID=1517512 RepID=A0A9P3B9H7_9EURO|nr:uncharacterized protein Asppvi_004009 [Aspergillus pseudoviridinutans]GIJ85153.1 hypothetical protein Asppvi_004009 [Aspergillus pseudoviridinutans]